MGQQPEKGWRRAVARATGPGSGLGLACASPRASLTATYTNVFIKPKPGSASFLLPQILYVWQMTQNQTKKNKHPNPKPSSVQYFLIVKVFFLLACRNHCKWCSLHAPTAQHTVSKIARCCSVSILHLIHLFPGCCWSAEVQGAHRRGSTLPTGAFSIKREQPW